MNMMSCILALKEPVCLCSLFQRFAVHHSAGLHVSHYLHSLSINLMTGFYCIR